MKPKVSIILVNYNGDKDTLDCVSSLEKIIYKNYEIIVVDNASDNQGELENKLPTGVVLIKSKKNLGFSGGNNLGIKYAMQHGSSYVLLLNNDTVVENDFLDRLVEVAEKNENVGIVTGKILFYSDPNRVWFGGGEANIEKAMVHHLEAGQIDKNSHEVRDITFVTGCLMLISKETILKVGMLDDSYFMYSEDVDYCCRIAKENLRMLYAPKSVIYHKVSVSTGGKNSPFSQYYRTRNDMIVIEKYANNKAKAFFYYILRLLKRNLVGQFQLKYTLKGLKAYFRGEKGKSERI